MSSIPLPSGVSSEMSTTSSTSYTGVTPSATRPSAYESSTRRTASFREWNSPSATRAR